MESVSSPFNASLLFTPLRQPNPRLFQTKFPPSRSRPRPRSHSLCSRASKSPRGFGPSANKTKKQRKNSNGREASDSADDEDEDDDDERESDVAIPEVVTNRMMRRMGLSVGIPLSVGLLFFPFFYYLKAVAKLDVPTWIPFLVSFVFFGAALLGVSYGIVSASWDPLREGSLLGFNEARRNWPVFWDSLRGGAGAGNTRNRS